MGTQLLPWKGHSSRPPTLFGWCLLWPQLPISATAELLHEIWAQCVNGNAGQMHETQHFATCCLLTSQDIKQCKQTSLLPSATTVLNCSSMTSSVKFSTKYLQRLRMMKRALYACHVNIVLQSTITCVHIFTYLLPHTVKCRRFCFWRLQYLLFCFCIKHLWNHWMDLRQIHMEDMFGPLLGQVWRSSSEVKGQSHPGQKTVF